MSETYTLAEATMKVIQDRRSIREFTDEPVSDQDLDLILEAARQWQGRNLARQQRWPRPPMSPSSS